MKDIPHRSKRIYTSFLLGLVSFVLGAVVSEIIGSYAPDFFLKLWNGINHDPTILAALLGGFSTIAATVLTSVIIYRQQQGKRELSWSIISDTPVLTLKDELTNNVQILFDNQPLSDARILVLKLWNSGNTPILSKEYEEPLRFSFGNEVKIVSAEIIATEPAALNVPFKIDTENVIIGPLLLNSKDTITFKALVAGHNAKVNASGRIAGLSQLSFKLEEIAS